jgi:TolB-like protein
MTVCRQTDLEDLSPRQRQVFDLMARGLTNAEIARTLGVQAATVKTHVSRVLGVLDVSSRTEAVGLYGRLEETRASIAASVVSRAFDERPSLAVMPFVLLGEGGAVARLGLTLTEDLTQRLAMWRLFPVFARCATWSYQGRAWKESEVAEHLGARYLVEGSVQPAAKGVRVSVKLVDGETFAHLWEDHYVVAGHDLIEAQTEVACSIIGAIYPRLLQAEFDRHVPRDPRNLGAWELAILGLNYLNHPNRTEETIGKGRALFREAAALDPQFVLPHFGLAFCSYIDVNYQLGGTHDEAVRAMKVAAQHAREADPKHPLALLCTGVSDALGGDSTSLDSMLSEAIARNPCEPRILESYGSFLALREGRYEESLPLLERAERLTAGSPQAFTAQSSLASAHMAGRNIELARAAAERAALSAPNDRWACFLLAAVRAWAGDVEAARGAAERLRLLHPHFDSTQIKLQIRSVMQPDVGERIIESVESVGL